MSSKTKTTATEEEATPTLLPKLRFPEFRKAQGWTGVKLGSKTNKVGSGITPTGGDKNYKLSGRPFVRSQNIGWGVLLLDDVAFISEETHNSFSSTQIEVFDVLLNITGASIGRSAVADARIKGGNVNQHVCIIRVKPEELSPYFLNQYLISHDGQKQIDSFQAGGNRQGLNFEQIRSFLIPLPAAFPEQQKIAEFLSSVDDLTAAQARKVDALKTHKKGLMQQLFPRDDETQPRLRFPEFHNAGEWEVKSFSDLCDIKHGYAFESEFFSNEGEYVLLTPGNFYEEGGYRDRGDKQKYFSGEIPRDYLLAEGDMLVAMTEQAAGLLGSPLIVTESDKFLHNQRLGLVVKKNGVAWANEFFYHVFNTQRVRKAIHDTASGAKVRHTSPRKTGDVVISVPTTLFEQQRIATCLSSLDALITAETQKHEALKTHKKGLIQQLFPSLDEADP